jgi:hypothetical protein
VVAAILVQLERHGSIFGDGRRESLLRRADRFR